MSNSSIGQGGPARLIQKLQKDYGLAKRLFPKKTLTSVQLNGAAAYIPYINKLTFTYQPLTRYSGGTSTGVNAFLMNRLLKFAHRHPHIDICVQRDAAQIRTPPSVVAVYNNGVVKKKCLRNLQVDEVATIVEDLSYGSGVKAKKAYSPVIRAGVAKEDVLQTWNPITSELSFKP